MNANRHDPALIRKLISEREEAYRLGKKPCILWVRVSTNKDEQKKSFTDQQEFARKYAETHDMHVCYVWAVKETGSKAGKRINFQHLLEILTNDFIGIKHVVCKNRKRLKRNMQDTATILALAKQGVTFHYYVDGSKDEVSSSASQRLVSTLLSAVDAYEPDQFSDEMKLVYAAKAEKGIPPSTQSPLGYKYNRETKLREKDPLFESVCQRLHDEFDLGKYSIASFVEWANGCALFGRHGARWHKGSMEKFLKRIDYCGKFIFKNKVYDGSFPPYITHNRFLDRMERMTGRRNGVPLPREHILRKFVLCAECGKVWIPELREGAHKSGVYIYYRHKCSVGRWSAYAGQDEFLEALSTLVEGVQFAPTLSDEVKNLFREDLQNSEAAQKSIRGQACRTIAVAEQKKSKLLDAMLDGTVSKEDYSAKKEELDALIRGANAELARSAVDAQAVFEQIEATAQVISEFPAVFSASSKERRLHAARAFISGMIYDHRNSNFSLQWLEPFSILMERGTLQQSARKDGLGFVLDYAQERT